MGEVKVVTELKKYKRESEEKMKQSFKQDDDESGHFFEGKMIGLSYAINLLEED